MTSMFQRPSQPVVETDIVIVGAGLAGIFTGMELKRRGKDIWILGSPYESQLAKAGPLTNVVSIPEGTIGLDYMEDIMDQAKALGIQHKSSLCTGIVPGDQIEVKTKYQNFLASKVIITTGAKQAKLDFKGESEFLHKGISDCTVCDFGLFRGKKIAVLGNHEYTWRASNFMIPHVEKVILLWYNHLLDKSNDTIEIYDGVEQLEAFGDETLKGVRFVSKGQSYEIGLDGLFVEGQPIPATDFLESSGIELNDDKYIKTNDYFETNLPFVYSLGDVTGKTSNYESVRNEVNNFINTFKF